MIRNDTVNKIPLPNILSSASLRHQPLVITSTPYCQSDTTCDMALLVLAGVYTVVYVANGQMLSPTFVNMSTLCNAHEPDMNPLCWRHREAASTTEIHIPYSGNALAWEKRSAQRIRMFLYVFTVIQCPHLIPALNTCAPGHNTQPTPYCHPVFWAWMPSKLNVALIRKLSWLLMCLVYYFDMLYMGVCKTVHLQRSGRLVQELIVCTVATVCKLLEKS